MSITGVILAGGLGRRMGGIDKGLVNFHGAPIIFQVISRLMPQVDEILINANRETGRYAAFGYPVISDQISGFAGPLAGLHAGMLNAKNDFVLTVPCDSPLLPENLAERLMEALIHAQADIAIAQTGAQLHPVFCLCNKSLLPELTEYLLSGERKVETWVNRQKLAKVNFEDNPQAFANVNTPEELAALEKLQ